MLDLPDGISPRLRSGAAPRPTQKPDGPEARTGGEVAQLARDAAATWREVMGDRRERERDLEKPTRRQSRFL